MLNIEDEFSKEEFINFLIIYERMRGSWKEEFKSALDNTERAFRDNPANFSDERALAEHVRSQLVNALGTVDVAEVDVNDSNSRGSIPDHRKYTARYREVTKIDCAHCEIGGQKFPFSHIERIDLGLFDDRAFVFGLGGHSGKIVAHHL